MTIRLLILSFMLFFLQFSCTNEVINNDSENGFHNKLQNDNSLNSNYLDTIPNPAPTPTKISKTELARYETAIYTILLRNIYHNSNERFVIEPILKGKYISVLCQKTPTISPISVDELKDNPNISKNLLENFIQANLKQQDIGGFDVKASIEIVSGDRDLEKLFPKVMKKYTKDHFKVKAIVGLSKIGFNDDMSKAIIYVEYFSPDKKLQKIWVLMQLHNISDTTYSNLEISEKEIIVIPIK